MKSLVAHRRYDPNDQRRIFGILRGLFFSGFALSGFLVFIPIIYASIHAGEEPQFLSLVDITRVLFQARLPGIGSIFVAMFGLTVIFAVLALIHPRRWVFVAGSCYSAFCIVIGLASSFVPNIDVERLFLPTLLGYIASAATLVGFWVKPVLDPRHSQQPG